MSDCKYYQKDNSMCLLGLFNTSPSEEDCKSCNKYNGVDRGLGDRVSRLLKSTGVETAVTKLSGGRDCGCSKRRAALNKSFPTKDKTDD